MSDERKTNLAKLNDGLENIVSGMGTSIDPTTHNYWRSNNKNLDHTQLSVRFREDWIAQKICKTIPEDMTREWRAIDNEAGQLADEEFRISCLFREAQTWARLYGTSAILLDIKGDVDVSKPLNIEGLSTGCINSLHVIDRTRLFPTGTIELDPLDPEYGLPTHYQLGGSTVRIHKSRLIRFEGTELPRYLMWKNSWYSDSTLIPLIESIDNFYTAAKAAASLTTEANVDIVSVEGLEGFLSNPAGEALMMKRMRLMKRGKSIHNMVLLDNKEVYDQKTINLNGVKDLIWEYLKVVAASVGIPATRFLSTSPDGMNATGESDLNNYIDLIKGQQQSKFDPRLKIIDRLLQKHFGIEPWKYKWNSAFPQSPLEVEKVRSELSTTLAVLVEKGILSSQSALDILTKEDTFKGVELKKGQPQGMTNENERQEDKTS